MLRTLLENFFSSSFRGSSEKIIAGKFFTVRFRDRGTQLIAGKFFEFIFEATVLRTLPVKLLWNGFGGLRKKIIAGKNFQYSY